MVRLARYYLWVHKWLRPVHDMVQKVPQNLPKRAPQKGVILGPPKKGPNGPKSQTGSEGRKTRFLLFCRNDRFFALFGGTLQNRVIRIWGSTPKWSTFGTTFGRPLDGFGVRSGPLLHHPDGGLWAYPVEEGPEHDPDGVQTWPRSGPRCGHIMTPNRSQDVTTTF